MPTQTLLLDVLVVEDELIAAQRKIARLQASPIGKLPFVRSSLDSRQNKLNHKRNRIEIAKEYLVATM